MHVTIFAINAREPKDGHAEMQVTIGVNGVDHLELVIQRLNKISGVMRVSRTGSNR